MNTDQSKGHLIIDATHGGIKLATEYKKKNPNHKIYLYDIYNTLSQKKITQLKQKKITTINSLQKINNNLKYLEIIYPIHLPLTTQEISKKINKPHIQTTFLTHHQAVKKLFKNLKNVLKIEITGVKGKTSSAFILKEIFNNYNPILLTSLGIIHKNNIIQKNISITPANILTTINTCKNKKYQAAIFENSLGTSAIGDIGLLTNITENYPIAKKLRNAAQAKSQIFKNKLIAINLHTLNKYYKNESTIHKNKINTFSLKNTNANLYCLNIKYGLKNTKLKIKYNNIKTINNKLINGEFKIYTFAPYKFHVENILGAICVALSAEMPETEISNRLKKFKGLPGRTNIKKINNKIIIEEINPGINTKAIEYSLNMIKKPEEFIVIIGGDYGITCEEIKEDKLSKLLNKKKDLNIILTGPLGKSIWKKNNPDKFKFVNNYKKIIKSSLKKDKNILFIYRTDYRKLKNR